MNNSFWKLSTGEAPTGEVNDGGVDVLPKGYYPCMIEECNIDTWNAPSGDVVKTIKIKARVVGEVKYKNRVVFLALKVFDEDEKKRDRAINLLVKCANILNVSLPTSEPDDNWLSKLMDKPLQIGLGVWDGKMEGSPDKNPKNFLENFEAIGVKVMTKSDAKTPVTASRPAPMHAPRPAEKHDSIERYEMQDDIDPPF